MQTVVAVDDAAIEIVEIGGRETAAFERHERAQVRRDDRQHFEDHPFGARVRGCEALHELEALGELLADLLDRVLRHRLLEFLDERRRDRSRTRSVADGLGAHAGVERRRRIAPALRGTPTSVRSWFLRERGVAGIDDDVILVIDDALELAAGHVEHEADARGHALVEPDVRDRHGQLDVAHALAAHAAQRDFDAAAVADDALVLDALVFAAGALPVAGRPEDALAEQAAFFGLERAVVDRFGILDLALAPGADRVGRGDGDARPGRNRRRVPHRRFSRNVLFDHDG